jgi:hypothetical protein
MASMAGRRHKSFRSGDISEELGFILLKAFATVAPVPRTEDVGVDAIVTLLRDAGEHLLIAEDSFYVQLKSSSDDVVEYSAHEVEWLRKLKLPFFIGSVDKRTASIRLFCTHKLSLALIEKQWTKVRLFLNETERFDEYEGKTRGVPVGPPILRWSVADISSDEFAEVAYQILKSHLIAAQINITYRESGFVQGLDWTVNELPKQDGGHFIFSLRDNCQFVRTMELMAPHFRAIISRCTFPEDRQALEVVGKFVDYVRRQGFDLDPNDAVGKFLRGEVLKTSNYPMAPTQLNDRPSQECQRD